MSHIRSTSGPIDSRITRTRSTEAESVGTALHLHLTEAHADQARAGLREIIHWMLA
jgi:hypothetical protein